MDYIISEQLTEALGGEVLEILGGLFLFTLIISFVLYVLASVGTMKIARRCGVPCYGLAWIPIGMNYVQGAIADYYSLNYKQKKTIMRATLPILAVLVFSSLLVLSNQSLALAFVSEAELAISNAMGSMMLNMVLSLILVIVNCIALFRVFKLCDPDSAAIYLVLSILMSFMQPIFLFVCRNKPFPEPFKTIECVEGELVEDQEDM